LLGKKGKKEKKKGPLQSSLVGRHSRHNQAYARSVCEKCERSFREKREKEHANDKRFPLPLPREEKKTKTGSDKIFCQ